MASVVICKLLANIQIFMGNGYELCTAYTSLIESYGIPSPFHKKNCSQRLFSLRRVCFSSPILKLWGFGFVHFMVPVSTFNFSSSILPLITVWWGRAFLSTSQTYFRLSFIINFNWIIEFKSLKEFFIVEGLSYIFFIKTLFFQDYTITHQLI